MTDDFAGDELSLALAFAQRPWQRMVAVAYPLGTWYLCSTLCHKKLLAHWRKMTPSTALPVAGGCRYTSHDEAAQCDQCHTTFNITLS